jgi:hypothetical protein
MARVVEIKEKVASLRDLYKPEDMLFLFDMDMTLTQPDHPAVSFPHMTKFGPAMKQSLGKLTPEQKDVMLNLVIKRIPWRLVDPSMPSFLTHLQEEGIRSIVLTGSLSGPLEEVPRFEVYRYENLKKIGLDFSSAFPQVEEIFFQDHPSYLGHYPVFYKGILCTNGLSGDENKGSLLKSFLDHEKINQGGAIAPQLIVLVDDKRENLEDVARDLAQEYPSLVFLGIEYTGASSYEGRDLTEEDFIEFWQDLATQALQIISPSS